MNDEDKAFWEIKEFKEYMEEYIQNLSYVFEYQAKYSSINRNELRQILLELIEEML